MKRRCPIVALRLDALEDAADNGCLAVPHLHRCGRTLSDDRRNTVDRTTEIGDVVVELDLP